MALTTPNAGAKLLAERALNKTAPNDCKLKLYENNVTISESTVVGDCTEATFSGYTAGGKTLTGANWTVTTADPASASYALQEWTSDAVQTKNVYGYYVTDNAGTTLLWIEQFSGAPYSINNIGDKIQVTPVITFD